MKNGPYELVIAPKEYPGKKYRNRYVYEHQLVWWQNTGELVPEDSLIHHKNHDKRDNRFENFELKSRKEHSAEHSRERRGADVYLHCDWCTEAFSIRSKNHKYKLSIRQETFCCSVSCSVKLQLRLRRNKAANYSRNTE